MHNPVGRYFLDFDNLIIVDHEDLGWLSARGIALHEIVQTVCGERIHALRVKA